MKVLLTGATGFLGSHVLQELVKQNIYMVVLKRSFSNDYRIRKLRSGYTSYDIDRVSLSEIFEKESKIDAVIHCATSYGRQNEEVSDIFQTNVCFPLRLLEIASCYNTDIFINTDTFFCKMTTPNGYMQSYVLSKKQFKDWGRLFAGSEKIKFVNLQLEHLYGEGDDDSKFTSYVVNSCLSNVEKIDLTDGEQLRDFVYIEDVVSAFKKVLFSKEKITGYNEYEVGYGKAVKVKDFVNTVKQETKSITKLNFGALPYRKNEILYSQADITKLRELGWVPKYDIQAGVRAYLSRLKSIKC
ncbi:NAD(P)-dependent oxidoreductase [Pseudoclostridium thermosuccinogenes]|uniref:NAD-dependent epimerase/dehydratase family protein n=1 Tax=Clostridium thermosuccinogenes TaxID=84032 RepID=UPI002FD8FFC9